MHVNERLETYQVKRKPWKRLKNTWERGLEWKRVIWRCRDRAIEREIKRNESWIAQNLYKKVQQISKDRGVKRCREKQRRQMQLSRRCRGTKQKHMKRSSIDTPTLERLSRIQELSRSIHLAVEEVSRLP